MAGRVGTRLPALYSLWRELGVVDGALEAKSITRRNGHTRADCWDPEHVLEWRDFALV